MKLRLLMLLIMLASLAAWGQNVNFSSATPAAPAGGVNLIWQHDTSSPVNLSAYIPGGTWALISGPITPGDCAYWISATQVADAGFACGQGGGGGAVTQVFGRTGIVTAQPGDYTFAQLANTPTTLSGYGITDAASNTWTINGHQLNGNISLLASDLNAFDLTANNNAGAHFLQIGGINTPANPPSGFIYVYFKTGSGYCQLTSTGTETCFGAGGGGGAVSSVSADGALYINSGSTGAVALTLGQALAHRVWGNNGGASATPAYVQLSCGDLSNASPSCNNDATNATNIIAGTLPNARLASVPNGSLANSSITLNGTNVALGATANIPFQTNTVNNISQSGLNLVPSTTNGVGLIVTPTNTNTNQVRFEVTGGNYTGNAATANGISSTGANGTFWGVTGGSQGWFTPNLLTNPMLNIGEMIGGGVAGAPARIPAGLTGQSIIATNAATPSFASGGVGGRTVTSANDTILCDSVTSLRDRGDVVTYNFATAVTVAVPDAGTTGCGGNFYFGAEGQGVGTVTFNRTTASTFTVFNGATVVAGATSFTIQTGQYALISSPDNVNYHVHITTGGGAVTAFTGDGGLINNSGSTGSVTVGLTAAGAHNYWGNSSGVSGAPGYHTLVAGDLPSAGIANVMYLNAPNTGTTAVTMDLSSATTANAFKTPVLAGCSSGADGSQCYDSTNKLTHIRTNAADSVPLATTTTDTNTSHVPFATAVAGIYTSRQVTISDLGGLGSGVAASLALPNVTTTVGTSAITANTCTSATTVTMTGLTTSMTLQFTPTTDTSGITGWGSTGGLTIVDWPTANTINYKVCNQTGSAITPTGSVIFNVSAR